MKQIKYSQVDAKHGELNGILRIDGSILYFKSNNNSYTAQLIEQLKMKGADIQSGKDWVKVDMFKNQPTTNFIIQGKEFDLKETPKEEIQNILFNFYITNLTIAKFKCEGSDV